MTLTDIDYETADLRDQICQDLVWWKKPQEVDDSELLRRIMNPGTWEMLQWARNKFPVKFFVDALTHAKYGDFSPRSWHYWHIKLGISPIHCLPKNQFLTDGIKLNFPGS